MNYDKALEFASEKHKGQYRKGTIVKEYIEHPKEVSTLVDTYLKDSPKREKYIIVALLHDTLEDTSVTYEEEKELFGEEIANMVLALTNDEEEVKRLGKGVYLTNKLLNLENDTLIIKLCDRLCNIKDLMISEDIEFRKRYIQDTIYIINNLLLNRKLNETQLRISNDIVLEINEVMQKSNIKSQINKKIYIYEK